jgi:hypothetical protein
VSARPGGTGAEGGVSPYCAHGKPQPGQSGAGCTPGLPGDAAGAGPAGRRLPLSRLIPGAGTQDTDPTRGCSSRVGARESRGGRQSGREVNPSGAPTEAEMSDQLLRQRQAAGLLNVSVSYLRASTCPKRLLPSNGAGRKPMVRYLRSEVLGWALARRE